MADEEETAEDALRRIARQNVALQAVIDRLTTERDQLALAANALLDSIALTGVYNRSKNVTALNHLAEVMGRHPNSLAALAAGVPVSKESTQ